ncbi:MAG TPA: DUF5916 domain-containing protein [Longimicrobiales bacterium]|nr:DUF5916 domain-containing protein [Longimicrobiales bacterium]
MDFRRRSALRLLALSSVLVAPAVIPAPLTAQDAPSTSAPTVETAPVVDGRLDDAAWAAAPVIGDFVQREPVDGRPVSQRTEVRVVADAEALYIGAWLYDEDPSGIVLGQTRRDASLDDSDAFAVILDTYRDRQNGFVFATTPAGIEWDGQVTNEGQGGAGGGGRQQRGAAQGFNLNWDGSWTVATSTDGSGWYAEMRIPFSTLRYDRGGAQTWGVNFERRIRRNSELSNWSPLPRQFDLYRVSMAGAVELEVPARRVLTVTPYVLGETSKDYEAVSPEWDTDPGVGGDAKIGLTPSLTLDLTVNTDFAAVEVDDQQVNLTRFPLFFPEKRPFFLENAGSFTVGSNQSAELFFSRRIGLVSGQEVPIMGGARLSGKVAGFQVGLLDIQTDDLDVLDPELGTTELVSPRNNFGVLRVFREFANRTRLGGIFVSRVDVDDTDDRNFTWGIDGRLGIGQDLTFDGWFGLTDTPGAGAVEGPGDEGDRGLNDGEYGFNLGGSWVTRDWEAMGGYRQVGETFNPEVGFLSRSAYRHGNARILRHIRVPNVSWFREFRPHVSWNQYWDLDGFSESYLVHVDNHFAFENGAFFQLPGLNFTGEGLKEPFEIREGIVIPAGSYDNVEWSFRANTDESAPLSISGGWTWGGFYNGTQFTPNATVTYRFRDRFTAAVRMSYFDVSLDQGDFTTSVIGFDGSWSFTPRIYLSANVQYNDDTRDVGTNLRFGWLDTAGTGLFVVYNQGWHRGPFDRTGIPSGPRQRQLIVKYTKLFDFTR